MAVDDGESSPSQRIPLATILRILNISKIAYPAVVFGVFLIAFVSYGIIHAPRDDNKLVRGPGGRPLPVRAKPDRDQESAKATINLSDSAKLALRVLHTLIILTFVGHAVLILLQVLLYRKDEWWPGQAAVVFVIGSFFAWSIVLISLIDTTPAPTLVHLATWVLALPCELLIIASSLSLYTRPHHEPAVGGQQGGHYREKATPWEIVEVTVHFGRAVLVLGCVILFVSLAWKSKSKAKDLPGSSSSEQEPLLGAGAQPANGANDGQAYGTTPSAGAGQNGSAKPPKDAWAKPTEPPNVNWFSYIRGFFILIPYLWPKESRKLQGLAIICFMIMISQRVLNVFVPMTSGWITDALSGDDVQTPWLYIGLYVLFKWLQGSQGILSAARTVLWIPVEQYSYRAISTAAFEHVHNLSAEFHMSKRTGEVISALNKGSAINSFLELVTFQVGPMMFDLVVAVIYLTITFDIYLGLVVAITTILYIYVTIRLASWRVKLRRDYVNADREMEAVKNDSLHSWDTVKYFNAEQYEFSRYRNAMIVMQGFEYWVRVTLAYLNSAQGAVFTFALLIACFIEAYRVAAGFQTVGHFVILITYMAQLQGPLNFFGTFYRTIQNNLISAERMLELFREQPLVDDKEGAEPLTSCTGEIEFRDVNFSYDERRNALSDLSFHCAPGTTTALVGESGGGKSTIMRMLFRYYNPTSGSILVDGHDVQDITIDSLRKYIGIVPQDCNMFNESLLYNLRYANQNATDEEIFAACRAASIHDRIMDFPDGYGTVVGERGVKLSGGERQRVAIARTILKNPRITLLDEATAALDTDTEEKIQHSFATLAKGRTMLIIAHRLSTIVNADQILVLKNGTVVERGTHEELIGREGRYASMWRKQSRAQKAREEAEQLRDKARQKLKEAEVDSASVTEDEAESSPGGRKSQSDDQQSRGGAMSRKPPGHP
ncbi:ABC transporter family protein [Apiospora rasikravindrae]|uniref:ABC transporter family protein n=1 Tax=Apiospora rasikravindrae TaxID=990691 RepID=A0ABR1T0G1_9PEZI